MNCNVCGWPLTLAGATTHPNCSTVGTKDDIVSHDAATVTLGSMLGAEPLKPPTVWDLHNMPASWRTFEYEIPSNANPGLWLRRVFGDRRSTDDFDVRKALPVGVCHDCGNPYAADGSTKRCLKLHWATRERACGGCRGVIDYAAKKPDPKALVTARIVSPTIAKQLGWTKVETNALWNFEPRHASCTRASHDSRGT